MTEATKQPEPERELDLPLTSNSVAIQRIIDEIRVDRARGEEPRRNLYDRTYSRHNRS